MRPVYLGGDYKGSVHDGTKVILFMIVQYSKKLRSEALTDCRKFGRIILWNPANWSISTNWKSFFSTNCSDGNRNEVHTSLHIETQALEERYLGLPTAVGSKTTEVFEYIPERIRTLVGGLSEKTLSGVGREVLIKSIAQPVPTYSMSCFQIPAST